MALKSARLHSRSFTVHAAQYGYRLLTPYEAIALLIVTYGLKISSFA
jgi:hypothetical protein